MSVALISTFSASSAVPALPGATKTRSARELWRIFHARACSRPPLPTIRTFMSSPRIWRRTAHAPGVTHRLDGTNQLPVPVATGTAQECGCWSKVVPLHSTPHGQPARAFPACIPRADRGRKRSGMPFRDRAFSSSQSSALRSEFVGYDLPLFPRTPPCGKLSRTWDTHWNSDNLGGPGSDLHSIGHGYDVWNRRIGRPFFVLHATFCFVHRSLVNLAPGRGSFADWSADVSAAPPL